MPTISTEHWASLCNYLPPAAVEYLRTKKRTGGGRQRAIAAVKRILVDAEEMEAAELVVIDKANKNEIRLLPPKIYLEAWQQARSGESRKGAE
jgi:hypothetical protein